MFFFLENLRHQKVILKLTVLPQRGHSLPSTCVFWTTNFPTWPHILHVVIEFPLIILLGKIGNYPDLTLAVINGNTLEVENLIDDGADVNVQDKDGYTPLIWAAFFGHVEILENLMVNAATINKKVAVICPCA